MRKMVAVSGEVWKRLKKLQIEETDGGTVPTMSRLIGKGLQAMEILADLLAVLERIERLGNDLLSAMSNSFVNETIASIVREMRDNAHTALERAGAALGKETER